MASRQNTRDETHFGEQTVPLADKQSMVDGVFHSVARRYDLMNDLMSGGLHRTWKDALVTAVNPSRSEKEFAVLDLAGGTGDVAFRVVEAGGPGTRVTVCDINAEMLAVGRERAARRGHDNAVTFEQGNAEQLPYPDRSFDCVTIAFGIRNVPRIERALSEAHRVLRIGGRFLCLEFSSVDVPGIDKLYELYSFQVIPRIGQALTGDREAYQYLVEFDPQISQAPGLRQDDRGRGLPTRQLHADDRRRGGAAFGLEIVIAGISHLTRLAHAGFVFAREGVFALVDTRPLPLPAKTAIALARLIERPTAKDGSSRLASALTKLGPTYVKLGQFLATRPDVVGKSIATDLESLQDKMAPFPQAEAEAVVAAAFDKPLAAVYASFGPAVAAASIAQVHRAEVDEDGARKAVAVKILRPGIERRFKSDLDAFFYAARKAENFSLEAQRLRPVEAVATLARSVAIEMDFRLEAAALSEMAENTREDTDFRVPGVDWDHTAREVLTLEWIDGTPLNDHAALAAKGFDLPALGRNVIQSFLRHALRDGFFHADMHPGNLFVDADGRLVAVDFGIMGRLGPKERRFLAEILFGFITRDYQRTAQVHFDAGYVPRHHSVESFAQAIRAIGEPIHNRSAEDISMAKLLMLLFEVTGLFDMRTRPELLLLQKTMVVVEGVARSLDPKLDMWSVADPVVRQWIERHLGPAGKLEDVAEGAGEIGRFLGQVPGLLTRAGMLIDQFDDITRNGLVLSPETVEAIGRAEQRRNRWTTVALWTIAALLAWTVWRLL